MHSGLRTWFRIAGQQRMPSRIEACSLQPISKMRVEIFKSEIWSVTAGKDLPEDEEY